MGLTTRTTICKYLTHSRAQSTDSVQVNIRFLPSWEHLALQAVLKDIWRPVTSNWNWIRHPFLAIYKTIKWEDNIQIPPDSLPFWSEHVGRINPSCLRGFTYNFAIFRIADMPPGKMICLHINGKLISCQQQPKIAFPSPPKISLRSSFPLLQKEEILINA
jgi:hypothetical protein